MKKRLLSLLLLVAMIVTALPLAVLPAIAAETGEKEYTAEDYNALYVQNGLIFALDFFGTNSYWGEVAKAKLIDYRWSASGDFNGTPSGTVANGALDMTSFGDYIYTKGLLALTSLGATGVTSEYVGNFSGVNSHSNFLRPNDTTVRVNSPVTENGQKYYNVYSVGARWTGSYDFREADGTLVNFKAPIYDRVNTLTMAYKNNGFTQGYYDSYMYPSDVVLPDSPTLDITKGQQYFYVTHSYDPEANNGEGGVTKLATPSKVMYATFAPLITPAVSWVWDATAGEYVKTETAKRYIYSSTPRNTAAGVNGGDGLGHTGDYFHPDPGHLSFYVDGTAYYDSDVYYPDNSRVTGETYIYKQSATLNAFRQYNRILTAAELAQNRFADLAKWFRIDLGYVKMLNAASLTELYPFAAALTFEDEAAGNALEQKAKALAEAQYSSLDADVLAVAAAYDLDLSPLEAYPKGVLPATYTFLLSGIASSEDVAADYAAAVKADIDAYFAMGAMALEDYNALYVQDGYLFGIDFFASNKIWSPNGVAADLGADYAQPAGLTKDDLAVYTVTKTLGETVTNVVTLETEAEANAKLAELTAAETEGATYAIVTAPASNQDALRNAFLANENAFLAKWVSKQPDGGTIKLLNSTTPLRGTAPAYTNLDQYLTNQIGVGVLSDGYLQLRASRPADNYLNMTGMPMAGAIATSPYVSDAMTQQIVGVHDAKASNGNPILMFGNARINVRYDQVANGMTFYSVGTNFTPSGTVRPSVSLSSEATTLTFELRNFKSNALTNGAGALDIKNGTALLGTVTGSYAGAGANAQTFGIGYGNATAMKLYAYRHYTVALSNDDLLQNHFADLAKFFRLNLSGFAALDAAEKKAVYASVANLDLTSDRTAVQMAVSSVLTPLARGYYEDMKGDDAKVNAFLDIAADYLLDVSAVLAAKRDVSSVYETVTADALAGKTAAEAQAILDEAYYDAYYYLSYKTGDEAFDGFLTSLAENATRLETEALMALPKADRLAAVSLELTQDAIDTYVEEKMAAYKTGDYDYDSLYVQDGLLSQTDFFKLNSYWGESYTLPTAPSASVTNSDLTAGEILQTDGEWIVVRWNYGAKDAYHHGIKEDGAWSFTTKATLVPTKLTEAEAKAEVEALLAAEPEALYEAIPYAGDNGQGVTSTFKDLIAAYTTAVNAQLAGFTVKGDRAFTLALPNVTYKNYHDQSGAHQRAPFTYADGYLQMDHHHSNSFLLLKPAMPTSGTVTGEYIITSGAERAYSSNYMHTSDVTVKTGKVTATSTVFNGFYTYNGTFTETSSGRDFATPYTAVIGNNTPYSLATVVDRGDGSGSVSASLYFNGTQIGATETTTDTTPTTNIATQIAYSSGGTNNRIYAIRYYDRALTAADYAQNHFADLAKFYRLDVAPYAYLSAELRAELYAAVADFTLSDNNRGELADAVNAVLIKAYNGIEIYEDEAKNEEFLALAAFAGLDLSVIKNLSAAARAAIADPLLAEFDLDYAVNADVVTAMYQKATYSLGALTFAGYQVRIDTGAVSQNYAGVRGVFDVNEEIVKTLAADETVTLTVAIKLDGVVGSTIAITYDAETDTLEGVMTTGDKTEDVIFYERDGKTSFNYTVVYKGDAATAANYAVEYSYAYTITVGGAAVDFAVKSETFGETVSAFELYEYFSNLPEYENDRVIAGVLALAE